MEKGPHIRIVGGGTEEQKNQAKEKVEKVFRDNLEGLTLEQKELLKVAEVPKSASELILLDFVNQETSRLMADTGIDPYNIPVDNIHIIKSDFYKKKFGSDLSLGRAYFRHQTIILSDRHRGNPIYFGLLTFHELLHLKGHFSIEVEKELGRLSEYREGVTVNSSILSQKKKEGHQHFLGLHEAIVSEAEKQFLPTLLNHPLLKTQKQWLESTEGKSKKRKLAETTHMPEDEIFWVSGDKENKLMNFDYKPQRDTLNYICDEIVKQFPEKFQNSGEVFKVFLKAHFSGQLLEIGRLVDQTFGSGSFRILGNMETSKNSGDLHLDTFRKLRK